MPKNLIVSRLFLSILSLLGAASVHAAPSFTITGLGDESILENTQYFSPTPVPNGVVTGTLSYSFDPFSHPTFCDQSPLYWVIRLLGEDSALFSLDSASGIISLPAQDFENPQDSGGNNIYSVTLFAVDSASQCSYLKVNITVENQPAVSFALTGITPKTVYENTTLTFPTPGISGETIGSVIYHIEGADASLFSVNSSSGQVQLGPQDFESPADANSDHIYQALLVGTDGDDNQASVAIQVTILDLAPLVFSLPDITANTYEHADWSTALPGISGSFRSPIQFSLSGEDAGLFSLANGAIHLAAQNFEAPLDADNDNTYTATLTATDSDNNTASSTINVTIVDIPFDPEMDDDGDGVINMVEVAEATDPYNGSNYRDVDNDGLPDALDADADNDGLPNTAEDSGFDPYADRDGDFVPDYLDADDRGDGVAAACSDYDSNAVCDLGLPLDPLFDRDGDGRPNHGDIDSDGDLLPDSLEGSNDSDADLLPDSLDSDSDNDGIPDLVESGTAGLDGNGNGIADRFDVLVTGGADINLDGIDDLAAAPDTDLDGLPDYRDADADNDLIPDALEGSASHDHDSDGIDDVYDHDLAGGFDNNHDGISDSLPAPDTDTDGTPDYLDSDSDGDGIADTIESGAYSSDTNGNGLDDRFDAAVSTGTDSNADGILEDRLPDTDADTRPDFRDLDSDNDTLTDVAEAGGTDVDEDGLQDGTSTLNLPLPDSDLDGLADYLDVDSNNDGDFDIGATGNAGFDTDNNGMVDPAADPDRDGIDSAVDNAPLQYGLVARDSDGDGIPDSLDHDQDNDGISDALEGQLDADGDGLPNYHDLDSDNDGISDYREALLPPRSGDANANGVDDSIDVLVTNGSDSNADGVDDRFHPVDTDGDGIPDFLDSDSDNDNLGDRFETSNLPLSLSDSDGDGIDDVFDFDTAGGSDLDQDGIDDLVVALVDNDGDSLPDYRDRDSDNDGISDKAETTGDADGDTIANYHDRDSDNDGIGDLRESGHPTRAGDGNGNGLDDTIDVLVTGGTDADADGVDDAFAPVDSDRDGTPDYLDTDADNDGLGDLEETGTVTPSGTDSDADGIDDVFDVDQTGGADADLDGIDDAIVLVIDTDHDGKPNHLDSDSDNDDFPDGIENDDTNNDGIPDRLQAEGEIKGSSGSGSTSLPLLLLLSMAARRRLLASGLACALLSVLALPAHAEEEDVCRDYRLKPSTEMGFAPCFYAGGGLGISAFEPDADASSWKVADDGDAGFSLYGGYHFARDWFAELALVDLGEATLESRHALLTTEETIGYRAIAAYAGYYLPLQELFKADIPVDFFVKAGIAQLAYDASTELVKLDNDSETVPALAVGIEWPFRPRWTLRGEIDSFSAEVSYLNVSVAYWFGGDTYRYTPAKAAPAEPVAVAEDPAQPAEPVVEAKPAEPVEEAAVAAVPPSADTDLDGIVDPIDECPGTPAKTRVDRRGCARYTGFIQSLYGAFNSTDLTYPSYGALDTIILLLKTYPDTRIEIQAHTDDRGTTEFNQKLSEQRAAVVKQYLVDKGIDASRIEAHGYGESKPLGSNETPEGRSKNRRIDFNVLGR